MADQTGSIQHLIEVANSNSSDPSDKSEREGESGGVYQPAPKAGGGYTR
jgi:hypothetical protein